MGDPWVRIMRLEMQLAGINDYHRDILDRYTDMIRLAGGKLVEAKQRLAEEQEARRIEAVRYAEAMHDTLAERDLARMRIQELEALSVKRDNLLSEISQRHTLQSAQALEDQFEMLVERDHLRVRVRELESRLAELSETALSVAEGGRLMMREATKKAKGGGSDG